MSQASSGYSRYVYVAAGVCALGGLLFGFDTGIISGALLFIKKDLALSPFLQSAVVSAILVGAVVGAGSSGPLADRFGQKTMTIPRRPSSSSGRSARHSPRAWDS